MGMPAVPAYVNVALLMGPLLVGLGIATFTAHMFIFYFAVASAITPPVALAAFAAALSYGDVTIAGIATTTDVCDGMALAGSAGVSQPGGLV